MNESQLSKEIAIAGKRDSSIMMGITVGKSPLHAIPELASDKFVNWLAGSLVRYKRRTTCQN